MIDREKVANGLRHCLHYDGSCLDCPYDGPNCQNDVLDDAIVILKEQRTGKWIEYPKALEYEGAYLPEHIVCSACEHVFCTLDNCTEEFNFCPHCGAKMTDDKKE